MIEDNMRAVAPRAGVEWPTIALIGLVYSAWLGLTWFHDAIALPLWLIAAALCGTLWGSTSTRSCMGTRPAPAP